MPDLTPDQVYMVAGISAGIGICIIAIAIIVCLIYHFQKKDKKEEEEEKKKKPAEKKKKNNNAKNMKDSQKNVPYKLGQEKFHSTPPATNPPSDQTSQPSQSDTTPRPDINPETGLELPMYRPDNQYFPRDGEEAYIPEQFYQRSSAFRPQFGPMFSGMPTNNIFRDRTSYAQRFSPDSFLSNRDYSPRFSPDALQRSGYSPRSNPEPMQRTDYSPQFTPEPAPSTRTDYSQRSLPEIPQQRTEYSPRVIPEVQQRATPEVQPSEPEVAKKDNSWPDGKLDDDLILVRRVTRQKPRPRYEKKNRRSEYRHRCHHSDGSGSGSDDSDAESTYSEPDTTRVKRVQMNRPMIIPQAQQMFYSPPQHHHHHQQQQQQYQVPVEVHHQPQHQDLNIPGFSIQYLPTQQIQLPQVAPEVQEPCPMEQPITEATNYQLPVSEPAPVTHQPGGEITWWASDGQTKAPPKCVDTKSALFSARSRFERQNYEEQEKHAVVGEESTDDDDDDDY